MLPRPYTPADYPTLASWWTAQKWTPVPELFLPKTGFVIDGVCAAFLYRTDGPMAWLEWIISNPAVPSAERSEALDTLINTVAKEAAALGHPVVFTSADHPGLLSRLAKHGFKVTGTSVTQLMKGI